MTVKKLPKLCENDIFRSIKLAFWSIDSILIFLNGKSKMVRSRVVDPVKTRSGSNLKKFTGTNFTTIFLSQIVEKVCEDIINYSWILTQKFKV